VADPPYPKGIERRQTTPVAPPVVEEKEDNEVEEVEPPMQEMQQDYYDTNLLPFPRRNQKAKMDE
jgi:hypothetical protein